MKKFLSLSVTLIMISTLFTGCLLLPENSGTSPETTKPTSVSETTTVSETTEESVNIEEETTVPIETTISTETVSETEIPVTEETPSETTLPEESENSVSTSKTTIATTTPIVTTTRATTTTPAPKKDFTDKMVVHFIDVGQGDSIFIELPNDETMLIDAGETDKGSDVVAYIHSKGYDTLDYVVATHPHSDHIGGMSEVINNFNVKHFYMTTSSATSQAYTNMLKAVKNSKASAHSVMAGDKILNDRNLLIEVVAPKAIDADEMNNNSIVIKLTYGDNKFLFTGDAEKSEEDGIWTNIKCDVLKIGHHGSNGSSSANFLKKVEPKYAVISCGLYNSYGHPTDAVLKRLNERNIKTYRTDIQGTIVFTSDGKTISVNVKPSEYKEVVETTVATTTAPKVTTATTKQSETPAKTTYVLNTNTKKIHFAECSSVKDMKEENKAFTNDYNKAIADGYKPCGRCKP